MLPKLSTSNASTMSSLKSIDDIESLKKNFNPFFSKISKVYEIKIYLKNTFHKTDIDDKFISDLEKEYAEQFLIKINYLPTKDLIKKILTIKPIELCDFHLSTENIKINGKEKNVKIIHIYPNNNNLKNNSNNSSINKENNNLVNKNIYIKNSDFENFLLKKKIKPKKLTPLNQIKNNTTNKDNLIYNKEKIDDLFSKAKDDILDKQLFFNEKSSMNIDFSINNIRKNYIIISNSNSNFNDNLNTKSKLINISKSINSNNILLNENYKFPLLSIENLNEDILKEITQPIEIPIELIMKDINYILDKLPIEELITYENNNNNSNNKEDESNNNNNYNPFYFKISINNKEELITVYHHLQSNSVYRIIGLTLNLIYWIIFGNTNNIQIDYSTKQYLYLKLLKEINFCKNSFINKKLMTKIFFPLLIIIMRIESDNIFSLKFKKLFLNEKNKILSLKLINNLISEIFDPYNYYNTFSIISVNPSYLRHKFSKSILPKFKNNMFSTSKLIENLFSNNNDIEGENKKSKEKEIESRKNFIMNQKIGFFTDLLTKVNNSLKGRNLEPIFSVKRNPLEKDNNNNNLNVIDEENENNINNNNEGNERYDEKNNVIYYIEHSKLKDIKTNF
jgi:hypothetical protein